MAAANWFNDLMSSFSQSDTTGVRQKSVRAQYIRADQFRALKQENPDLVLLDVRTEPEYRETRIPGSRLLPVGELNARQHDLPENKDQPIVVYCLSGARSRQAANMLVRLGYTSVFDLGSIMAWPYEKVSG